MNLPSYVKPVNAHEYIGRRKAISRCCSQSKDQPMCLTAHFYDQNKGDPLRDLTAWFQIFFRITQRLQSISLKGHRDMMEHFVLVSHQVHSQSLSSRLAFMLVSVVVTQETSQRPDTWIEPSFLVVFPLAPKICTTKHTIFSGTFHCHFYNMVQWFTFDFMPDRCGRSWSHCHRRSNGRWMQFHRIPGGTFVFQPPGLKVLKYDPVARQKETSNTCDLSCVPGWFSRTPSPIEIL